MAKVNAIRARVASAREAVACAGRADLCEEELSNLKKDYADRMDLQLGELLVQRGIKVAEVVKTWPKPRGSHNKEHTNDVGKEEFKDEVCLLGLLVAVAQTEPETDQLASTRALSSRRGGGGALSSRRGRAGANGAAHAIKRPVTRKEVGLLFDQIDEAKTGWLSLKELRETLKSWQTLSKEALAMQQAKDKERANLRRRAANMLQASLRVPDKTSQEPTAESMPESSTAAATPRTIGRRRAGQHARRTAHGGRQRRAPDTAYLVQLATNGPTPLSEALMSRRSSHSSKRSSKSSGSTKSTRRARRRKNVMAKQVPSADTETRRVVFDDGTSYA